MQSATADFIVNGHFVRHLQRMRRLYAARRSALTAALTEVFGTRLRVETPPGGMHLIARAQSGRVPEARAVELCRKLADHIGLGL